MAKRTGFRRRPRGVPVACNGDRPRPARRGRGRGLSLVEVLVASLLLAILLLGILQVYSHSLLVDFGSSARTELTYKCQQVVEHVRHIRYLQGVSGAAVPDAGVPTTFAAGLRVSLPYRKGDAHWDFWGPSGANVMEDEEGGPYQLFYVVRDDGSAWTVTVTAQPAARAAATTGKAPSGTSFLGSASLAKSVEYVARFPKP